MVFISREHVAGRQFVHRAAGVDRRGAGLDADDAGLGLVPLRRTRSGAQPGVQLVAGCRVQQPAARRERLFDVPRRDVQRGGSGGSPTS